MTAMRDALKKFDSKFDDPEEYIMKIIGEVKQKQQEMSLMAW